MAIALEADNLSKRYYLGERADVFTLAEFLTKGFKGRSQSKEDPNAFWALRDVSFQLDRGKVLGIVGRNGSGKSTLLKILSRITPPTTGRFGYNGTLASLLEVGTGFKQELSGRDNIFLSGTSLGLKRSDIRSRLDEIITFAEIEAFIDTPVKRYSSGMYVRLAFAVAAHLEPDILLLDEVLAVGDQKFQRKCLSKMKSVAGEGRTVCFVSHNMQAVTQLCHEAILLNGGEMKARGAVHDVVKTYIELNRSQTQSLAQRQFERPPHNNGAWIRSIDLQSNHQTKNHFDLVDEIEVSLEMEVEQNFDDLQLIFSVSSPEGMVLFCNREPDGLNASTESEEPLRSLPTKQGRYRISSKLPCPLLNTGFYELEFHLIGDHSVVIDSRKDIQIEIHYHHNSFSSCITHKRAPGECVVPMAWQRTPI